MSAGLPGASALTGVLARLRSLWRGARRRGDVEREMAEEFRHHLELRTEDLIRSGCSPEEAARRARVEFGHVEGHKQDARASRGLHLFDEIGFSWIDFRLGVRMLAKHPGLSVVSVIGMAVAIAIGAGGFGLLDAVTDPRLPLHEHERVVSLQNVDATRAGEADRQSLHDFLLWRDELRSVTDLAAFTGARRNLSIPGGSTEAVRIARMTASGFRVARVAPLLGRTLIDADERPEAPPVIVIAHDEWLRLFGGDPAVLGRRVRLHGQEHTVVGVMPEGFRFPVSHRYWVPLRLDASRHGVGEGPELHIFGRLAHGATIAQAQAELAVLGQRMAAEHPGTHARLRPQILPYAWPFLALDAPGMRWMMHGLKLALALLLVVVAVNVAVLVYARTATRIGEIAVRSALGASRRRIVAQLFAEAFVLSSLAATMGLAVAAVALETVRALLDRATGGEIPFWLHFGVSGRLVIYVAALALLGAAIVGILPALKATGRGLQEGLQMLAARGSQMRLGRTWSALIVAQVALAVAALPYAVYVAAESVERGRGEPNYPAGELLQAWLWFEPEDAAPDASVEGPDAAGRRRFVAAAAELLRRLERESAVAGVTFASALPANEGLGEAEIEIEGIGGVSRARVNRVDADYLQVLDIPVLAGRPFVAADTVDGANAVVVDRTFAEEILGSRDVVGRRVRHVRRTQSGQSQPGAWLEIVGVVAAVGVSSEMAPAPPIMYRPVGLSQIEGALAVRMERGTTPGRFAGRLRAIASEVDPALHLDELRTSLDAEQETQRVLLLLALCVVAATASVLLLSAAGIYAMMSFAVAKRRREIGIRSALGATPGRLLRSIFARAGAQLGAGVGVGLSIAIVTDRAMGGGPLSRDWMVLVPCVASLMLLIGILAAAAPARRGLAIQPTEALREE